MPPDAREYLGEASGALVAGVRSLAPAWATRQAARLTAAWGRLSPEEVAATLEAARKAGEAAGARVAGELERLFALDPAEQRATPLEIVRTVGRELTDVLGGAGLPEVVRDEFAASAWPDDPYDLVPRTFRDLDADLAAVHFAWGLAKAQLVRARAARGGPQLS
ncbi:MAG: hypothetical protein ACRD0C_16850 [Acidimicrobiia bacterium]